MLELKGIVKKGKKVGVDGTWHTPRTMWEPGDYDDSEIPSGKTMTDGSLYEPTVDLITRFLNGEPVIGSASEGYYEIEDISKVKNFNEVFEAENPTEVPGFDLADIASLQARASEIKAELQDYNKRLKDKKAKEEKAKEPVIPTVIPVSKPPEPVKGDKL